MNEQVKQVDIAIVGGGFVGTSLALALKNLPVSVALIDKRPALSETQHRVPLEAGIDARAIALNLNSQQLFLEFGIWPLIDDYTAPIKSVHISEKGRFGMSQITAKQQSVTALGYIVPGRILGEQLWRACHTIPNCELMDASAVEAFSADDYSAQLQVHQKDNITTVSAKLVIACDGAQSYLRELCEIPSTKYDYQQQAIVTNVFLNREHEHIAYERFTQEGIIAFLPLKGECATCVWTLENSKARAMLELSDQEYLAKIQSLFGYRLGKFKKLAKRQSYPLMHVKAEQLTNERLVILGNAAQSFHPVAAQGLNLGLRDVASLVGLIQEYLTNTKGLLHRDLLQDYENSRQQDRERIIGLTHGLLHLFGNRLPGIGKIRSLALTAFNLLPFGKRKLARRTMGF